MAPRTLLAGSLTVLVGSLLCSAVQGHSMKELKDKFGEVPESLTKITEAYENTPAGEAREFIHSSQHEMILDHQRAENKARCVQLLEKLPALERRLGRLEREDSKEEAGQVQLTIDKIKAFTTVYCPSPCK